MSRPRTTESQGNERHSALASDPLWYKDAILYEVRVGAYQDSDGDGIGDFRGLTSRLDYLHDLGITALWLLPFCPSPWRDDGYDISDYTNVHPDCGTLDDFKAFLRQAHRLGMRVITELVINHTSDQHPWFQRARRAPPGSRERNYYVWSDTPEKYRDARVIFKDFEPSNWAWDPVAKAYYWHRFYAHQPDLNFDHPDVRKAVFRCLDFWLRLGVDGLRLDAIPYLYEREDTTCENLPETHVFLKALRAHVDREFQDRMLLAEANQWSEDAVAYFGNGDECHLSFHFPVMPRLFMALHMENRYPIIDILTQTPPIPETCQWALFLRNHDELTLEMVTDEERDYMYRVYANDAQARINLGIRRRLAPLLGNDRRRMELMNALLLALPGTPVIYYGDEIGMGDNFYLGDRNGVRTPMQWSGDRNAGFSRANPQRLYLPVIVDPEYHYATVNVETQQANPRSLLWWMKRVIALRKRYQAFGRGTIEFLHPTNPKVLAFMRSYGDERLLIVANLSRFVQYVELDLGAYRGTVPVELFGRTAFPPISELPYLLTLGPHAFYWFALESPHPAAVATAASIGAQLPVLESSGTWESIFQDAGKLALDAALPAFLQTRRWFGGKGLGIKSATIVDTIVFPNAAAAAVIALIQVEYAQGATETYALPVSFAAGQDAARVREATPQAVFAELQVRGKTGTQAGILYDAVEDSAWCASLLDAIARRRQYRGARGTAIAAPTRAFRSLRGPTDTLLPPSVLRGEQSNTSIVYGEQLILKVFRRLAEGVNPDLEVGRVLTEHSSFVHTAPVAGALEYRVPRHEPMTLAILQGFVRNQGDAWHYTLEQLKHYFERALVRRVAEVPLPDADILALTGQDPPELVGEMLGEYVEATRLLGRRTAELHIALASVRDNPAFAAEPFTTLYQRSLYQSMRNLTSAVFQLLRERRAALPAPLAADAERLLGLEDKTLQILRGIVGRKVGGARIRCHGDYHLGQILYTGKDFVITDFEGEPARPLSERRVKRSPLHDVAGMLRSFDYAAQTVLFNAAGGGSIRPEDVPVLAAWASFWTRWVSSSFLRAYLHHSAEMTFLPKMHDDLATLLRVFVLDKSIYEIGYELKNRPDWVAIPLRGTLELLERS